ncbi:MAG: lytic transglycosylase domain-containing protein [Propionibacteriaceae bacterium]|nr:lytic transglycosylase domain-containing protein [Propionibacteriaceae bacterium]
MRWLAAGAGLVLLVFLAVPVGIIALGTLAVAPAVAEQIRLDPCSAYDTTTLAATTTLSLGGFGLPRWGTPRYQSLHSPAQSIPARIKNLYVAAGTRYRVPWQLLAGIGMAETRHGRNNHTSSAGAQGLMQFMPGTFAAYGVDGNADGRRDIHNDADSIFSAAHYLVASNVRTGPAGVIRALRAYNRSISYRNDVLYYAWSYAGRAGAVVDATDPADCLPAAGELPGFDGACPPSHSAAEHGLQPPALRGLRCVKAAFPAITSMGGRGGRPIASSDHPKGLAVDFMIPRWNTRTGNAYGWRVARWVQAHAAALRVKYVIWDAKKWNPAVNNSWRPYRHPLGNTNPTLAHRNHVHVSFHH